MVKPQPGQSRENPVIYAAWILFGIGMALLYVAVEEQTKPIWVFLAAGVGLGVFLSILWRFRWWRNLS